MVASPNLSLTVLPFILRSVALYGIDSAACGRDLRRVLWEKLFGKWRPEGLPALSCEIELNDVEKNHGSASERCQPGAYRCQDGIRMTHGGRLLSADMVR